MFSLLPMVARLRIQWTKLCKISHEIEHVNPSLVTQAAHGQIQVLRNRSIAAISSAKICGSGRHISSQNVEEADKARTYRSVTGRMLGATPQHKVKCFGPTRHLSLFSCVERNTKSEVVRSFHIEMSIIAVAGGTGQLGRAIVDGLLNAGGFEVLVLAREVNLDKSQCLPRDS